MSGNSGFVRFLYGTAPGRLLLKGILATHADRLAVAFLCSRLSRPLIAPYARRNGIPLTETQKKDFRTYRDLFLRTRTPADFDTEPSHLISPCDGWLSAYPIREDSSFAIKGSHYSLHDLLQDADLAARYTGGDCLVLRLCPSDYHHYCYIDDGFQGENHFIPGVLHSVQPIACEKYPVFFLNRRSWTLLHTNHFGPVVQTEIGALVVAVACALLGWQMSVVNVATAALEGFAMAIWPIVIVIIAAVFTYNLTVHTGAMETIKHMLCSVYQMLHRALLCLSRLSSTSSRCSLPGALVPSWRAWRASAPPWPFRPACWWRWASSR